MPQGRLVFEVVQPASASARQSGPTFIPRGYGPAVGSFPIPPHDRDRAGGRVPLQGTVLEIAAPPARDVELVGDRVAEPALLRTERAPLIANRALHLVCAGRRGPVDRPVLEVVEAADA